MPETFANRLQRLRVSKLTITGKPLTQEAAARLIGVCISAWRKWESGRTLPDNRSRVSLAQIWPDIFSKDTM